MEEQFYTTLFQFIITWCNNTNKYNWRSLAHLCWKEHIPSIYIRDSQLNRPESVSLASLARQLWYMQNFVLITRKEGGA